MSLNASGFARKYMVDQGLIGSRLSISRSSPRQLSDDPPQQDASADA